MQEQVQTDRQTDSIRFTTIIVRLFEKQERRPIAEMAVDGLVRWASFHESCLLAEFRSVPGSLSLKHQASKKKRRPESFSLSFCALRDMNHKIDDTPLASNTYQSPKSAYKMAETAMFGPRRPPSTWRYSWATGE